MIVLVDLDGVTANLEKLFWSRLAEVHPDVPQILPEDRVTFYIEEQIGQEWSEKVRSIIHAEHFYRDLEVVPGALEGIEKIQGLGHEVIICTAPVTSPWCAPEKLEWVARHLGTTMATHMIISKDKTLIRGDVLFDDRPVVSGKMDPEWEHVLCDQPYNRHIRNQQRATWETLPGMLRRIEVDKHDYR